MRRVTEEEWKPKELGETKEVKAKKLFFENPEFNLNLAEGTPLLGVGLNKKPHKFVKN